VITVPYVSTGTSLTINLMNSLAFTAGAGTNTVPTSLVIVGQLGGGLGTPGGFTAAPDHTLSQQVNWPIAAPGQANQAPSQGPRVQSFGTEVPFSATAAVPLTWSSLKPGTYLIESGTHPSIQGPMGLFGILVVTTPPATGARGIAYPTPLVNYDAEVSLLFSEIDPLQNSAVQAAVTTPGFKEDMVWSGQPNGCGNPSSSTYHQCYPPTVNYTPLYYLINGVAFDKTHASNSVFAPLPGAGVTGTVLVRMVNAGLRMHVPSIVGSTTGASAVPGLGLIAEDGNPLPGVTRVQAKSSCRRVRPTT
jgi:FtsP/CotA-like multicopper oxidase with cupredoxin domain